MKGKGRGAKCVPAEDLMREHGVLDRVLKLNRAARGDRVPSPAFRKLVSATNTNLASDSEIRFFVTEIARQADG
jgi:hypothetical protein